MSEIASFPKLDSIPELEKQALDIREKIIHMVHAAKSGHPGGPLGLADIFAALYHNVLNHNPDDPNWAERDRLILSNGHCCAVRYSAMAQTGYFPEEELLTFRKLGSRLQGHPSSIYLDGLETCSGSLGQGLSVATGLALGGKAQKKSYKVYAGISDGECAEGMTWEAATAAVHYKLDNLIAFVDRNYIQIDGNTEEVMALGDLGKKFEAFGWNVLNGDGHNMEQIIDLFAQARANTSGKPTIIVFETTLGKGVSFMENNAKWHGVPPDDQQKEDALAELAKLKK